MNAAIASLNALDAVELSRRAAADPPAFVRAAAEAGSAEAQARYGQMRLDAGDAVAAFGWFRKAAAQDHVEAINMLGRCHDLGWGTPIDKAAAARCFLTAARRGHAFAMYNYATLLALGTGVAEDQAGALVWFERSAALGNAKAANFIGSFHEDGWAVPCDMARAAACYARAARGGDFRGQFNHARMLIDAGRVGEARDWLAQAAANGNARFRAQAAEWLGRAADPAVRDAAALFRC